MKHQTDIMSGKINIFSDKWCDMIFENKNKEYGAYFLRKITPKNHFFAIIVAFVFFTVAISAPVIFKKITKPKEVKITEVTTLVDIKQPENLPPPPPPEDLPPPPPKVRFTPPEIKQDKDVKEEVDMPDQQKLNQSTAPIGNYNDTATVIKPVAPPKVIQDVEEKPLVIVEQMPEFPGGEEELLKYLRSNIKYPQMAKESGISGIVYIAFVISSKGIVKDARVLRGIGGGCDEEAIRVVKSMPNWKPGRQNSQSVPVQYTLPVRFVLE